MKDKKTKIIICLMSFLLVAFIIPSIVLNANVTGENVYDGTIYTMDENGVMAPLQTESDEKFSETTAEITDDTYLAEVDKSGNILKKKASGVIGGGSDINDLLDDPNNALVKNQRVVAKKYSVVDFRLTTNSPNTTYYEYSNGTGQTGYLNAQYGGDGAFLGYSPDGNYVNFMMSGVSAWVRTNQVSLLPIGNGAEGTARSISHYRVVNGRIIHYITTNAYYDKYASSLDVGPKQAYMSEGATYYSYDGHHFYTSYEKMTDDYQASTRVNSINSQSPYYNYYQFLSHRSKTNFTASSFDSAVLTNAGSTSKMYGQGSQFIEKQNKYGANAALMYGVAWNESAIGTSTYAQQRNNLFGHAAYDSDPDNASGYKTPGESIEYHAKVYVSEGYLDPNDYGGRYYGGHLGNKRSGMNVKYASDPYWGEKAANICYLLERNSGYNNIDYGKTDVGVKNNFTVIPVKRDPSNSSLTLYNTVKNEYYPFVILGSVTGDSINGNNIWYKVQTDPTLNSDRTGITQDVGIYNYANYYGYVHSSYVRRLATQVSNDPIKTTGITYMHSLTYDSAKSQYLFKGYSYLDGADNSLSSKNEYKLILKNTNTGKVIEKPLTRWNTSTFGNYPFLVNSSAANNGAWLASYIDLSDVAQGDYKLYIKATSGLRYNEAQIENIYTNQITRKVATASRSYAVVNDFTTMYTPLLFTIRDNGLLANSTPVTFHNMINDYSYMKNEGGMLRMVGTSYNVGVDYNSDVTRKLVFENTTTYQRFEHNLNAIAYSSSNPYTSPIVNFAGDSKSKRLGWYDSKIDLVDMPVGTYDLYVVTNAGGFSDYGKIEDIFARKTEVIINKNNKTYKIFYNTSKRYFQLIVT